MSLVQAVLPLAHVTWHLYRPDHICTVFADGLRLEAAPDHARDVPTAQRYGFGRDTRRLWLTHDLLHSVIMPALGYPMSPTLRHMATQGKEPASEAFRAAEEALVLDFALFFNGGLPPTVPAILQRTRE